MLAPTFHKSDLLTDSLIYRQYLAEREEILRHKWVESERVGFDIGYDGAWVSWVLRHRANWRKSWHLRNV